MSQAHIARSVFAAAVTVVLLSACSEPAQTAGTTHGSDTKSWDGAQASFATPGWKPGDKESWEEQLKQRNHNQNEYVRLSQ